MKRWHVSAVAGKLGLLMLAVFLFFGMTEFGLRVMDPPFFSVPYRVYHARLGWTAPRHFIGFRSFGGRVVRFETNQDGFRDRNHAVERAVPIGGGQSIQVRRVVVLGDSFAEAAQVELEETFWSILERRLRQLGGDYWEVVNLGVGDWGTVQQYLAFSEFAAKYRPDVVVLQVFPLNDIFNNSLSAANLVSSNDAYRPYLNPGTEFGTITHLNPWTTWVRRHSLLGRQLVLVLNRSLGAWGREEFFGDFESRMTHVSDVLGLDAREPSQVGYFTLLLNCFASDVEQFPMVREGWIATELAMERIEQEAIAVGVKHLLLLIVPHVEQLQPKLDVWRKKVPYQVDGRYAERRLAERFETSPETHVIPLVSEFEREIERVLPPLAGHFNRDTHRLVADVLEREIREVWREGFAVPGEAE